MSGVSAKIKDKIPGYNSLVKPVHLARAVVAGVKYGWPAKDLTVIGVTGTNGKTTTCFMIWKMLNESGRKAGLMTTVAWGYRKLRPELNHMTTVDSKTLNERILKIKEAGAKYLVLEVTSHAMEQFRTLGVPVEVAVFTNLTHDHLDYHKTFKNYRNAKTKLFTKAKYGVVNADDENAGYFTRETKEYITYGIKKGDLRAKRVRSGVFGTEYSVDEIKDDLFSCEEDRLGEKFLEEGALKENEVRKGHFTVKTPIPGVFNVYNSLAAVAVGERLGLTRKEIAEGIGRLENVEGRMNRIEEGQNFSVIVDYAHTPDALEKVFKAIRGAKNNRGGTLKDFGDSDRAQNFKVLEEGPKRVIAVHGGAGRRDETTREERGRILGKNSDIVIITEDDSRDENPEDIAQSFVQGAEKAGKVFGKDLFLELDRGEAIKKAILIAEPGDLVLLLGKGHEKTILRGERMIPFQDIKVAKKWILYRLEQEKVRERGEEKVISVPEEFKKEMKKKKEVKKETKKAVTKEEEAERDKDGRRIKRGLRLKRKT